MRLALYNAYDYPSGNIKFSYGVVELETNKLIRTPI
jgi:hypothetical protein